MKIVKNVLVYVGLGLASIVAFVFMFLEWRSLFAGDHLLFNNAFLGGLAYFLRGLYYLLIIALAVFIVLFRTHNKKICIILFAASISLLIGAFLTLIFYDYFVALVVIVINLIHVVITSIGFFKKEPQECLIK